MGDEATVTRSERVGATRRVTSTRRDRLGGSAAVDGFAVIVDLAGGRGTDRTHGRPSPARRATALSEAGDVRRLLA